MAGFRGIYLESHLVGSLLMVHTAMRSSSSPVLGTLLGSISSSSSTSSLEHKPSYPKKLNARGNNKKTMSKSPSVSSRASAGIYGFFNQAFLVFLILVCL